MIDLSSHYLKRFQLAYDISFNLHCMGINYDKWAIYYNYYQDMLIFHGMPNPNENILGLFVTT